MEILGAENREKMWEEFPDTFGGTLFWSFSNFENSIFQNVESCKKSGNKSWEHLRQILERILNKYLLEKLEGFSDPENGPNLG